MHSYILQDWTTIRAANGVTLVTQSESGWLDLAPYQDVNFWIDVREYSGSSVPNLLLQTSPNKEEGFFISTPGLMASVAVGPTITNPTVVRLATATYPIARYVRWQLSGPGSGGWDATFRVLVAANALGL